MECRNNVTWAAAALMLVSVTLVFSSGAWAASKYRTLHRFNRSTNGYGPVAGLILDKSGNLYGTTVKAGASDEGTVFELTPSSGGKWTETVLYSFCSLTKCVDGGSPVASLIFDETGNLYGTTSGGGANGWGTVFKLTPSSGGKWTESVLYSFCSLANCGDGALAEASLTFDPAGNLYGTTSGGGATGAGVVFALTPSSGGKWTESVLYSFCSLKNCVDGFYPYAGATFDPAGKNLYGTTEYGGGIAANCATGCGVVYELTPHSGGGWSESVLSGFCSVSNCSDGASPVGGVTFDQAGSIYGTTLNGGNSNNGIVFELTQRKEGGWEKKVLHKFSGNDGAGPWATPIFDGAGNLYGTTAYGATYQAGVVFKLVPNARGVWKQIVLHVFANRPGADSFAGVILDTTGNLYGTTAGDYYTTHGSVFQIAP